MISTMYWAICVQVTARMPPSIEQTRMPARPDEHRDLEVHAEEARGDDAGAEDLRRHVGERAAHQHDHAEEAGEVAAEPERQEVRHGVGAELAQIRPTRIDTSTKPPVQPSTQARPS